MLEINFGGTRPTDPRGSRSKVPANQSPRQDDSMSVDVTPANVASFINGLNEAKKAVSALTERMRHDHVPIGDEEVIHGIQAAMKKNIAGKAPVKN